MVARSLVKMAHSHEDSKFLHRVSQPALLYIQTHAVSEPNLVTRDIRDGKIAEKVRLAATAGGKSRPSDGVGAKFRLLRTRWNHHRRSLGGGHDCTRPHTTQHNTVQHSHSEILVGQEPQACQEGYLLSNAHTIATLLDQPCMRRTVANAALLGGHCRVVARPAKVAGIDDINRSKAMLLRLVNRHLCRAVQRSAELSGIGSSSLLVRGRGSLTHCVRADVDAIGMVRVDVGGGGRLARDADVRRRRVLAARVAGGVLTQHVGDAVALDPAQVVGDEHIGAGPGHRIGEPAAGEDGLPRWRRGPRPR